jgi:hypothetical protein
MLHVEPRRPKRRKWLWRALWGLLIVVGGTGAYWWWSYHAALAERDALFSELRARGEPILWMETAEKILAAQSPDSGAELYMKALWTLGGEMNRVGPRVPSAKLEDDYKDVRLVPAVRPDVEKELSLAAPALAILEEAVKRPPGLLTTALKTDQPIAILLPHVQDGRNLARLLHWKANDALGRGDVEKAYHAVWLSLESSEQLAAEPLLISQLVRMAMQGAACESLSMCLRHAPVPEATFRAIDKRLGSWDEGFGIQATWLGERALWMSVLEDPKQLKDFFSFGLPGAPMNDFEQFAKARWYDVLASPLGRPVMLRTQSAFLRLSKDVMKTADRPNVDPEARREMFERFKREAPLSRMGVNLGDWGFGSLNMFLQACEKAHRRHVMARLALRLRRHYDMHGTFPKSLDELCDADMPRVRIDWFQNRPIVYRPSETGFRLEVPDELLTEADKRRKKERPNEAAELALAVEIKKSRE